MFLGHLIDPPMHTSRERDHGVLWTSKKKHRLNSSPQASLGHLINLLSY